MAAVATPSSAGSPSAYDCRSFNLDAYKAAILQERQERFSTVFAVCFVPCAAGGPHDLLAAASSTGEIRLYQVPDMQQRWLHGQQPAASWFSWAAHEGPVYCLAKVVTGSQVLLISGGEDGMVKGWRLADVLQAAAAKQQQQPEGQQQGHGQPGTCEPAFSRRLPRADSPFGGISMPPAVLSFAYDGEATLYAGTSDGACHAVDIATGSSAELPVCHAAAVLSLDYCPAVRALASGSEDGTAVVWDLRVGGQGQQGSSASVLDVAGGRQVHSRADHMQCLSSSSHVPCVRFDPTGSWLLCGHGSGALSSWSLAMPGCRAKQVATGFVPQAMVIRPAEVLMVGTRPVLAHFSMALERPSQQPIATQSAFSVDVSPDTAAVAVGGCHASVELLSKHRRKLGGAAFVSHED